MNRLFDKFAHKASEALGHSWVFCTALGLIIVWLVSGPLFNFSNEWQLVINTTTTIATSLMVFILQNTTNRENLAIHAKLDSLIKHSEAENALRKLEEKTEAEIRQARLKDK